MGQDYRTLAGLGSGQVSDDHRPKIEPPPPPSGVGRGRISIHLAPWANIPAALDFLGRVRPNAVILVDPGYGTQINVNDVRTMSPATKIIVRRTDGIDYRRDWSTATRQDGYQFAAAFYTQWIATKPEVLRADALQLWNEPKPDGYMFEGFNLWINGVLDFARYKGFHIAAPVFSTGYPGLRAFNDPAPHYWELASTHELLRRMRREGDIFSLHEYRDKQKPGVEWDDPFELFRHEKIYEVLPSDLKTMPLTILEYGDERLVDKGDDAFKRNVAYATQRLSGTAVLAVCLWTVGETSDKWRADRIDGLLSSIPA